MHRIIVSINNKKNTKFIVSLLKKFDFVKFDSEDEIANISSRNSKGDWSPLIGIWKDRDINIENIRKKAWPIRI